MRKIALDTETTGLFYYQGHRIMEIGCVEIIENTITENSFQSYVNPEREIDKDAKKITGLTELFLKNKPLFRDIIENFFNYLDNAEEIIIHNAAFDINFINNELKIVNYKIKNIRDKFKIFDTLELARRIHPGKKNNLDALCNRYNINNDERNLHGALLDAKLLAKVYIEMTAYEAQERQNLINNKDMHTHKIEILKAKKQELNTHIKYIKNLKDQAKII